MEVKTYTIDEIKNIVTPIAVTFLSGSLSQYGCLCHSVHQNLLWQRNRIDIPVQSESCHSPLDYVKGINTTGAVRSVFIYTLCDPFGTIAGDNPDAG